MPATHLDGLPGLGDVGWPTRFRAAGAAGYLRTARCLARLRLDPARIEWVAERPCSTDPDSARLPRRIQVWGNALWAGADGRVVAEALPAEGGGVTVAARDGASGRTLWQRTYPPPEAAEWAERTPAWPGAQTEEIDAFLADDPDNLVLGLMRQSRRSLVGGHGVEVLTLPPYACQTDATRFDPLSGEVIWQASFPGVPVPLLAREAFTGLWSRRGRAGRIDLSSGANTLLSESPHHFGWPVRVGSAIAVPWHASSRVGVEWLDEAGGRLRAVAWPLRGVNRTVLHPIRAGVVLQTNEQRLWLLADDDAPLWDVRVKPYTYRVFQATSSAVFVGTDGKGGRLLGFDLASAEEVLNLRPAIGGAGDLTMVPGHEALLCPFSVSRSYRQPARLLVLSMRTLHHRLDDECGQLLGTWEHGAVCLGRHDGAQVAVFDLRSVT